MKNINKKYWINFYSEIKVPTEHSMFSEYVLKDISSLNPDRIIDIGCGNGRDSLFFIKNGYKCEGVDLYTSQNKYLGNSLHKIDATEIDLKANIYYARFFFHTIKENILDSFLKNINKMMDENSIFYFETRSTREITNEEKSETNFKSSIGEKHFRLLYSLEYLKSKLENSFNIIDIEESNEFAIYKTDKPYVIRGKFIKK